MANRRPLTEGIKPPPQVDLQVEKAFVFQNKQTPETSPRSVAAPSIGRVPFSMRIRSDFAGALKRASLERQLQGVSPNTLQDMIEQALEPWLRSNGYID